LLVGVVEILVAKPEEKNSDYRELQDDYCVEESDETLFVARQCRWEPVFPWLSLTIRREPECHSVTTATETLPGNNCDLGSLLGYPVNSNCGDWALELEELQLFADTLLEAPRTHSQVRRATVLWTGTPHSCSPIPT